jgi:prepilin-type N-terminal cleavage/methylation domain-containing protein
VASTKALRVPFHAKTSPRRRHGFSLVELMMSTSLASMIMTGVLSSFVLMGKNSYNAANYSVMEAESRRALEVFTQEARMADNVTWISPASVTLSIANGTGSYLVTYAYDSAPTGGTAQTFYRRLGAAASGAPTQVLVRGVSDFAFRRYKVVNGSDFNATNDLETKQLQITLRTVRTGVTTVNATNAVLSARVVLRNKHVST